MDKVINCKYSYVFFIFFITALIFYISHQLSKTQVVNLKLSDYNSFECTTISNKPSSSEANLHPSPENKFSILTITPISAVNIANAICNDDLSTQHFRKVNISWQTRGALSSEDILTEKYDLFWNRQYLVEGIVPEILDYYTPILDTPKYSLYWFNLDEKLIASPEYFSSKTIGLLNDQVSQSYYLQPSNWLKRLGVSLPNAQIKQYPDILSLYEAFKNREVDVISSAQAMIDEMDIGKVEHLLINDQMISGSWFIKKSWQANGYACNLAKLLQEHDPLQNMLKTSVAYEVREACL